MLVGENGLKYILCAINSTYISKMYINSFNNETVILINLQHFQFLAIFGTFHIQNDDLHCIPCK